MKESITDMLISKKKNLYSTLFMISYSLFLIYSLVGHIPQFTTVLKLGTYVGIGLFLINFFLQHSHSSSKKLVLYIVLMLLSLVQAYFSESYVLFKLMLFASAIKEVKFKDIIRHDMYLRASLIIIVVVLCQLGIAADDVHVYGNIARHSMGFTNPNTLGIAVFVLVCDILYINSMKLKWGGYLLITTITAWLYIMARCRTAVYGIIVLVLISFIYRVRPRLFSSSLAKYIYVLTPIVLTIITFITVHGYLNNQSWALEINDLLSGRVRSIANFVQRFTPTFFGQNMHATWDKTLDNTYAYVLYDLGIFVFMLFFASYFVLIKRNIKSDVSLCILFWAFMVYGLSEHLWCHIDYNVFVISLAYSLVDKPIVLSVNSRKDHVINSGDNYLRKRRI